MAKAQYANPSLWWRLSWQLSIVFVAVVAAVIFGLCVYGATILSPNVALEDHITAVLARSVTLDAQGQLEIRDTPELASLKEQYDGLWYVAATTSGSSVSYGAIPAAYSELAHLTHLFQGADIRGSAGTNEIASVEDVETAIGELRVLFGGVADKGWPVLVLMGAVYPIYVSLLTVALPAVFLAVPRIVRRALASVSEVARKASEIEPRRYDARLPLDGIPKEVAPLVIAFNEALDRLENEFRKRQHFLIDAAHELRTPIAIMQTRIDGTPEGQDRRRLLDDVARLAETAEQLLDFERNNQAIDLHETIDLVEVARTVVADLAPLAIADGYQISFLSEAESLERRGSPSALPRAVSNLVRNAIDHGGNRGMITVSVLRSPSGGGRISVADEGPGIPTEHRELVFEPFYRVTPKSRGAGLGLSLVKQVAANHGGEVSIESSAAGTRVTIELA
ncbi:signal transduction histidine kinase [Rhizobium leguminosarum]|uniref:histidine kinase n=2 Tax=Rhizobium/Agrobacterium group TaxID=227290 RepID=A0A7W6ULE0_9HYPH|nr:MULTISPECIES: HAMP domain-containing sensor histidine kinase [Rhizobium]MBB4440337.1 signal transduction histidine kinase [Rhizobium esperanzae]MDH6202981.1 signal transduction histidine kinase [Rhizobium leguminosarum]